MFSFLYIRGTTKAYAHLSYFFSVWIIHMNHNCHQASKYKSKVGNFENEVCCHLSFWAYSLYPNIFSLYDLMHHSPSLLSGITEFWIWWKACSQLCLTNYPNIPYFVLTLHGYATNSVLFACAVSCTFNFTRFIFM